MTPDVCSDWLIGINGTRALTKRIREQGMPNGVIAHAPDGKLDIDALHARIAGRTEAGAVIPVATDKFAEAFEAAYARDMAWRSARNGISDVFCFRHLNIPLRYRNGCVHNISFLESVCAQKVGEYLAGDTDQRRRID